LSFRNRYLPPDVFNWTAQERDHYVSTHRGTTISSFTSKDGLFCVEGRLRELEGGLALKKSGIHGGLYNTSFAKKGVTCADLGYTLSGGKDSCYTGLTTFYKSEAGRTVFVARETAALVGYADRYKIQKNVASLMADCSCHPQSLKMAARQDQCGVLYMPGPLGPVMPGAYVYTNPYNGDELVCIEGPFQSATYALAVMKSSAQLAMHPYDQIAATTCKALGFPVQTAPQDHCFPQGTMWIRTESSDDPGMLESAQVEDKLFKGGFEKWAQERSINTDVINNIMGCQCLEDSEVWQQAKFACEYIGEESHTPIRDWFRRDGTGPVLWQLHE